MAEFPVKCDAPRNTGEMTIQLADKLSNIKALARFSFGTGLPRSGMSVLTGILRQNPRFISQTMGAAFDLVVALDKSVEEGGLLPASLNDGQKFALLRSGIDAVYHDRAFEAAVFDVHRDWLSKMDLLVRLYPLCRFVVMVRNPASIVNSYALEAGYTDEAKLSDLADRLLTPTGDVGRQIAALREALGSHHAERIFVLDYDRLVDDPEEAMDVLYDFLRSEEFAHDFNKVEIDGDLQPVERQAEPNVLPTRMILQLSGKAFWRNLRKTNATLMLGRAR